VRLDFSFFNFFLLLRGKGGTSKCFFSLLHLTCGGRKGRGLVFSQNFFFHCLGLRVEGAHLNGNRFVQH